jgi:NUDIX domain
MVFQWLKRIYKRCFHIRAGYTHKQLKEPVAGAAGIIFTNGTHVLAAHQYKDGREIISGLGGKMELSDPTPYYTAVRETLEELFDIQPPASLISYICADVQPIHTMTAGGYINHQLSFDDLERLLLIVSRSEVISPIYPGGAVPTLNELILKRKAKNTSEVRALSILPITSAWFVDQNFMQDMRGIKR